MAKVTPNISNKSVSTSSALTSPVLKSLPEGTEQVNLTREAFVRTEFDDTINTDFNSLLNTPDDVETTIPNTISEETQPEAITQSLELGGENSKEITIEEANEQLQNDDPWLQRKMAEQKEKTL